MFSFFRRRKPEDELPPVDWRRLEKLSAPGGTRLITRELAAQGIRELEMVDVPQQLEHVCADLLLRFVAAAIAEQPQRDGATIGGALLGETQSAIHIATLRVMSRSTDPGSQELFRVVDYLEPHGARFPRKLMATHIALLAGSVRDLALRESLYRQSIELFPGEVSKSDGQFEFDRGENFQNYVAWEGLGDTLLAQRRIAEGEHALRSATERCPAWAHDFAAHIAHEVEARPELLRDPAINFWNDFARRTR